MRCRPGTSNKKQPDLVDVWDVKGEYRNPIVLREQTLHPTRNRASAHFLRLCAERTRLAFLKLSHSSRRPLNGTVSDGSRRADSPDRASAEQATSNCDGQSLRGPEIAKLNSGVTPHRRPGFLTERVPGAARARPE